MNLIIKNNNLIILIVFKVKIKSNKLQYNGLFIFNPQKLINLSLRKNLKKKLNKLKKQTKMLLLIKPSKLDKINVINKSDNKCKISKQIILNYPKNNHSKLKK